MINKIFPAFLFLLFVFFLPNLYAQVGVNTTAPDASSALDIQSTEAGLLIPRMTTAERDAITDPANALLVFDTDLNGYYFNDGTPASPDWTLLLTETESRDNYVIVKSEDDFPTASGGTITLDENTLYEVNGTISTSNSINVNGAYLIGKDTNEDIINYTGSGALFTGNQNASFRNITFNGSSGSLFNLSASTTNSLIAQSVVVNGFSSVGTVSGYGLVFFNVMQFIGNSDGITYNNIGNLLLNNMGWQPSNSGSYETFTGSFGFIQKVSGFTNVASGEIGFDVSSNPVVANGTLKGVVFIGDGEYVNPYTGTGTYDDYNFTNDWEVDCVGIPRESDDNASGTIHIIRNGAQNGVNPTFSISSPSPIEGTTEVNNLFRMSVTANCIDENLIQYKGKESRTFSVRGAFSYESTESNGNSTIHAFYIRKFDSSGNPLGVPLGTEVYEQLDDANDVRAIPLSGTVDLDPGDYVRIYGQFISNSGSGARNSIRVYSVSLTLD
ncbi:hypothetical protein [Mesonia mobilis]|uniref:Cell wall anchor protein n=1 Tax=Mesonia mobilis TaxID=369791 RepID=A0ABQ3BK00_9FLAO|nr:hypothetical protein [Mesonia mobilis]GGZ44804.1 hypothetical protein GCM10008088_02390 [Mesonia mobilis]